MKLKRRDKGILFHPYALYKMDKRGINKAQVIETVNDPLSVIQGKFGRKIAQKKYGRYLIRVVFEERQDDILIVTAYPAKPERYLRGVNS